MAVGEHRARCARWEAVVMSRLVAVSNRVGSLRGTTRAGGLAVALAEALQTRHGLWFGWSGEVTENTEAQVKPIGRAAGWERVGRYDVVLVGAGALKKKNNLTVSNEQ